MTTTLANFKNIIPVTIAEKGEHKFFLCDECCTIYYNGSFNHIKDDSIFTNIFNIEECETIKNIHSNNVKLFYNTVFDFNTFCNYMNCNMIDSTWNKMKEWLKTL